MFHSGTHGPQWTSSPGIVCAPADKALAIIIAAMTAATVANKMVRLTCHLLYLAAHGELPLLNPYPEIREEARLAKRFSKATRAREFRRQSRLASNFFRT